MRWRNLLRKLVWIWIGIGLLASIGSAFSMFRNELETYRILRDAQTLLSQPSGFGIRNVLAPIFGLVFGIMATLIPYSVLMVILDLAEDVDLISDRLQEQTVLEDQMYRMIYRPELIIKKKDLLP